MSDTTSQISPFSAQDALIATMYAAATADERISPPEVAWIARIVESLPIFAGYDPERISGVAQSVTDLFEEEDGLDAMFGIVRDALPESLNETAYALACDVIAADGRARHAELRLLEEMRHALDIDRLHAAAIERGARARFAHPHVHGLA